MYDKSFASTIWSNAPLNSKQLVQMLVCFVMVKVRMMNIKIRVVFPMMFLNQVTSLESGGGVKKTYQSQRFNTSINRDMRCLSLIL